MTDNHEPVPEEILWLFKQLGEILKNTVPENAQAQDVAPVDNVATPADLWQSAESVLKPEDKNEPTQQPEPLLQTSAIAMETGRQLTADELRQFLAQDEKRLRELHQKIDGEGYESFELAAEISGLHQKIGYLRDALGIDGMRSEIKAENEHIESVYTFNYTEPTHVEEEVEAERPRHDYSYGRERDYSRGR